MKNIITLLALTLSLGAFAQERVVLNSSRVDAPSATAILVRTSQTPDKVEVRFNNIQMYERICYNERVHRTCERPDYRIIRQCRDVEVAPEPSRNRPTGPRYNPPRPARRVCSDVRVRTGRVSYYDCSSTTLRCDPKPKFTGYISDKVKIKFKNLPKLGGTEEETFRVTATQNGSDSSNIVYSIVPESISHGYQYEVKKKGILGFDSYVIQTK